MRGHGFGVLGDIVVGILGAVIGGFIAQSVFNVPDAVNGINIISIVVAFVGAVILIALVRLIPGRTRV